MQYIADLHIHSKYSRACSKSLELEIIEQWCEKKGVDIIATADFTHPLWFKNLKSKLVESEPGLYKLKGSKSKVRFFNATEVACIYSKGGKVRRLHIVIFAPNLETVEKINQKLGKIGKLASDGRPILGLDAKKLAEMVFDVSSECMIIPAHAWTPWFAVFGSKSGFDSLEECFEELTPHIYSIETGLSSDPPMNWRLSQLDNITLISNSDAHSPQNIGREANVFDLQNLSYQEICNAIKKKDKNKFLYTIEFYPEEGMYHFDGHRACSVSLSPEETKKLKNICPVCKKPLTIGVLNRVDNLADREEGFANEKLNNKILEDKNFIPYKSLVGLDDVIAEAFDISGRRSKKVMAEYENIISKGKSEFNVLLDLSYEELKNITLPQIVEGIKRNREGKIYIEPGFDGQYGKVTLFSKEEKDKNKQTSLF